MATVTETTTRKGGRKPRPPGMWRYGRKIESGKPAASEILVTNRDGSTKTVVRARVWTEWLKRRVETESPGIASATLIRELTREEYLEIKPQLRKETPAASAVALLAPESVAGPAGVLGREFPIRDTDPGDMTRANVRAGASPSPLWDESDLAALFERLATLPARFWSNGNPELIRFTEPETGRRFEVIVREVKG